MDKKTSDRMEWRLYVMMAERQIRTATELQRKLAEVGVHISSAHLSRLLKTPPIRLTNELMWGLTTVLQCDTNDLWRNPDQYVASSERKNASSKSRKHLRSVNGNDIPVKARKKSEENSEIATGPKVTTFPRPDTENG